MRNRFQLLIAGLFLLAIGFRALTASGQQPPAQPAVNAPKTTSTATAALPAGEAAAKLAQADKLRTEGSFRAAREAYEQLLASSNLAPAIEQPAKTGRADALWRERANQESLAEARKALERLVEDLPADGRWRAEAAESLGDLILETNPWEAGQRDLMIGGWIQAVDYWGHATDIEAARPRYIALNFKIAQNLIDRFGGAIPLPRVKGLVHADILPPPAPENEPWRNDTGSWAMRNVLRVSQNAVEKTHAQLLLGRMRTRYPSGNEAWDKEGEQYLKQAAEARPVNEWTDDAIIELAQWYNNHSNYVDAAAQYKAFLELFRRGQSPFWEQAQNMLDQIQKPQATLGMNEAFAPSSYLQLSISYRNLKSARLVLRRVRPEIVMAFWKEQERPRNGQLSTRLGGDVVYDEPIADLIDDGKHTPQNKSLYLEPRQPGFYQAEVVVAAAWGEESQRLHLFQIGALAVAAKHFNAKSEAWVTDAETGKVVAGANVDLLFYYQWRNGGNRAPRWQSLTATTDADGIAHFDRPNPQSDESPNGRIYVMATYKDQPAWTDQGWFNANQQAEADQGRPVLYAWTDRPAYRPGDPIHWKAVMRFTQGDVYRMPQAEQVYVTLRDERGATLKEGLQSFDNFGALKGDLSVDRSAALGVIQMTVQDAARNQWSQGAQLCRIEEYKLPEFKIAVEPGKEQVKFGAAVKFRVSGEYYFGGPTAGAEAQLVVHRQAFWPSWHRPYPYEWLYAQGDMMAMRGGMRGRRSGIGMSYWRPQEPEAIVLQKTVKLDAAGKAEIEVGALTDEELKAARDRGVWGYSYRVEARVTDTSRREVVGNGSIKVARTAFAAYLEPERYIYLPGDKVKIDLKTLDPNDRPVKAEGLVAIYKRVWNSDKLNPQGVKAPGYDDTKLFTKPATTDAEGTGVIDFEPSADGYYYFQFETKDPFGETVQGETTVFVCSETSDAVGYRSGGVEIILDKKSYKRGETAHAMIAALRPGVAVWFAIEGETVHSTQVVKLDGTVKLVAVEVKPDYEPNVFLTAVANFDYSGYRDQKMLIVPPTRRFLDVKLTTEKTDYKPGEKAKIGIEVKDDEGKPVSTQLALGVADAATWAIQSDLAPDIRQFFWGRQRSLGVQTWNSAERYAIQLWKPKKDKPGEYEVFRREEIGYEQDREDLAKDKSEMAYGTRSFGGGMRLAGGAVAAESAAMPMNAPAAKAMMFDSDSDSLSITADESIASRKRQAGGPEPRVRTNFSATAFWLADIVTGADGKASAEVAWPDSLTTWKAVARAADRETRVGQVTIETKTNKPIMVRPQVPRFFTQGDQATLSAVVNNNTSATQVVTVSIDAPGLVVQNVNQLTSLDYNPPNPSSDPVRAYQLSIKVGIPANAQRRVDWLDVKAEKTGATTITMTALCPVDSDASSKSYPILEYGIEQFIAQGTTIREKEASVEKTLTMKIPESRREGSESMVVHIEPTLARAMVNALPYLADYPYGCVEQTLSRFVPSTIVKKTLDQLGIKNPKLEKELPDMIKQGLDRLYDFQHADGGWAWWKTGDSDPFMTAYVLAGLAQAREAGVAVKQDVLERAAAFLAIKLVQFENEPDMAAFSLYAMGAARLDGGHKDMVDAAYTKLWPNREKLNPYTRALLALACHFTERADQAQTLVRNMRNGIIEDAGNGTAHWGASGVYWRWSEGGIEATAYSLRALLAIDPQNALIDPAMTWLVRNRRGNRWASTRDTAIVVCALGDYIKVRGEDKPDWTAEVRVNGQLVKTLAVKPGGVFDFDGEVKIPASLLKTGDNTVTVVRKGTGVLYASAWLTYFTREAKIPEAGNEVFIHRKYFRVSDQPNLSGEATKVRTELKEGDPLVSGERVEVEMLVEAKNHYEYLLIEDPKAAGMEPVDLQSGWDWGGGVSAHREMRDEKTAFFISRLAEGNHTINYTLRAEIPGKFHALPSQIHAMYVPEIRANSEGREIAIQDKPVEAAK